jgi:malonyl-CoA/methylmalonyl-CoA synthetase
MLFAALAHAQSSVMIDTPARRWTGAELFARAADYHAALTALGIRRGDRLCLQVEKSVAAFALYLACLRGGIVFVPLNSDYTVDELAYLLTDADPAIAVCRPDMADRFRAILPDRIVHTLDAAGEGSLPPMPGDAAPLDCAPGDLAALLYTSGTTGRPKGAMLTHGNLLSNARTLVEAWRITAADRLVHALPTYHVHGLFVAMHTLLLAGGSIDFQAKFDAAAVMAALPRATMLMGVPTFYTRLLAEPGLEEATRRMRLFVSGSAPLTAETWRAFHARIGHAILERYGMTETSMIASNPFAGERRPGSVGPALPGVDVRITDQVTGAPLPAGEIGAVEVRGPNVFAGYWRAPEKTAAEFRDDGFFITGDLGHLDRAGYLTLVGRAKDLIITGGLNVYPAEVEDALEPLPEVDEIAVVGVPHPDYGEAVIAVVATSADPAACRAAITAHARDHLAAFKRPKDVVFKPALPRNSMGKVDKKALRAELSGLFGG